MKFSRAPNVFIHSHQHTSTEALRFPVKGQGTLSATPANGARFLYFRLSGEKAGDACEMRVTNEEFSLTVYRDQAVVQQLVSTDPQLLLNPAESGQAYWLSLDSNNQRLRYGQGEPLRPLMRFEFTWTDQDPLASFAHQLQLITLTGEITPPVLVLEMPVNLTPAPQVIAASELSLEIIAANTASVVSDLPAACQTLYNHVASPGINLAPADFPEFAQAIQYSIVTPGALCYEKLREKDPIFGYLRITLDPNLGDSPGQPYVLEIWPAGNGSPIHNHGHACAVIKVLHGQIQVAWYSALSPEITEPWGSMIAHAGQITFLTPNCYQIHRLFNPSPKAGGDFCATIQCYQYPADDLSHYEYFDYLEDGEIKHFLPDSDWTYLEFKAAIHAEWDAVMGGQTAA